RPRPDAVPNPRRLARPHELDAHTIPFDDSIITRGLNDGHLRTGPGSGDGRIGQRRPRFEQRFGRPATGIAVPTYLDDVHLTVCSWRTQCGAASHRGTARARSDARSRT